jgi:hypothetical protein
MPSGVGGDGDADAASRNAGVYQVAVNADLGGPAIGFCRG